MSILTAIGVASIISFNGVSDALVSNYNEFLAESNAPGAIVNTNVFKNDLLIDGKLLGIDGVKQYDKDLYVPCSAEFPDDKGTKSVQLFTFNTDDFYQPYFDEKGEHSEEIPNVYLEWGFADLNNIPVNSTIKLGYYEESIDVHVEGLISYPDTLMYGSTNALATENTNFGRIYVEDSQIVPIMDAIIETLEAKASTVPNTDPLRNEIDEMLFLLQKYRNYYSKSGDEYINRYIVYFEDNVDEQTVLDNFVTCLEENGIKVSENYLFSECLSAKTITSNSNSLKTAGRAISLFVFATVIIVLALFLLQIIREMMRDIGVMSAIGFQKEKIMVLLAAFSLIISIIGSIIGMAMGYFIEYGLDSVIATVCRLDPSWPAFRWNYSLLSFGMVVLACQFATFFASLRITKISPVDALNDQATSKKVLPESIEKKLQHASPTTRLTVNSIVTKPKRFITSFLAIFASGLIIFGSIATFASYNRSLKNTFENCIAYDAQVIFQDEPSRFAYELEEIGAQDYELCKYATGEISKNGKTEKITIQGLPLNSNKINIPTKEKKSNPIPEEGITVNMITAKNLGINAGDLVQINGYDVRVDYITQFEILNVSFCNVERIESYISGSVTSYLICGVDKEALIKRVSNYHYDATVTFTDDQRSYYENNFRAIKSACLVFIVFSVGLGALIVTLMMQTSLIEQRRDLCIMKSIGFSLPQISGIWSFLTLSQFIFSMIFAIPAGFGVTQLFLKYTATRTTRIMSYANIYHVLFTLAIIGLFLTVSHVMSMFVVKKWNIAENTKNRE